ncbi:hypothetical protein CPB84DRAFT_1795081 [Gymnopilus junonius]|uniref:Uncharacterized protein n=1 Tax=Gymnopilus junonius TaxID=109634 RepID=A0A9P5NDM9_GYMJU|nr:hypothetical protein CPB84DRAFT_1795081 [Gymnopilus junonius]
MKHSIPITIILAVFTVGNLATPAPSSAQGEIAARADADVEDCDVSCRLYKALYASREIAPVAVAAREDAEVDAENCFGFFFRRRRCRHAEHAPVSAN